MHTFNCKEEKRARCVCVYVCVKIMRVSVCVYECVKEREREIGRENACVCERERGREGECVCV